MKFFSSLLGIVTTVEEWPGGFSVVACDELTIAAQEILIGSQSIQAHRTAGVQLAGAHAHLGAKAIPETIRKASGYVMVDARGIDIAQEALGPLMASRQNRLGMS